MVEVGRTRKLSLREKVEKIVEVSGCTYLEAITHYMQENSLPPARIAKALDPFLFSKLQLELKHTKLVQTSVLNQFYSNGKPKMNREEAIECSKKIRLEMDQKESILKMIHEKKKRDRENKVEFSKELLIYESKLEDEVKVLILLSNLCYEIAGQ